MKDQKMKFIRKNGRVIPIKMGGKSKQQTRKKLDNIDIATGATAGLANTLLFKRKKFTKTVGLASLAIGAGTLLARRKNEDTTSGFIKEEFIGGLMKGAGSLAGAGAGLAVLMGGNKLRKLKKLGKLNKR